MRKVYCHVCANEIEDSEKTKYFYDLEEIVAPICVTCYEYIRIEIEIFKWSLISRLRGDAKIRKQQEAMREEFKPEQQVRETISDNKESSPDEK